MKKSLPAAGLPSMKFAIIPFVALLFLLAAPAVLSAAAVPIGTVLVVPGIYDSPAGGFIPIASVAVFGYDGVPTGLLVETSVSSTFFLTALIPDGIPSYVTFQLPSFCYDADSSSQYAGVYATLSTSSSSLSLNCNPASSFSNPIGTLPIDSGVQTAITFSLYASALNDNANGNLSIALNIPGQFIIATSLSEGDGSPVTTPEPGAIFLAASGLSGLLLLLRLRRNRLSLAPALLSLGSRIV